MQAGPVLKALVAAAVTLAVAAGAAEAQPSKNRHEDPRAERNKAIKAARERYETEKKYDEMMKMTRPTGPTPKTDPWSGVRSGGDATR
jgi:hypothetical protein